MASSSTSSVQKSFKYHVFLSFRGEDARKTIVSHVYHTCRRKGIYTFKDEEELEKGKRIDELFKAIEKSKFFIIVFSKNYASSSWCLKELAKIMECQNTVEQIVYPVFYDVDPAEVRKQSGEVGRAFAKHNNEHVGKWRKALEDAGNLVGWDLRNRDEAEVIHKIVEEISVKLRLIHLSNDENLIGIEARMQDMESSLGMGLTNDDVRMIGIKGMGGIGKTTLARAIFDKLSSQFEGGSFVENIREVSKASSGLLLLQKQVFSDVLNEHTRVSSVHDGIKIMKTRLPYIKILLVLDDVDHKDQLDALAGHWFKGGSRIIITTRDEKLLLAHGVSVNWIHDVNLLSDEEAISLFSRHAFMRYIPIQGYEKLSSEVVRYAAGLPLTIKVLGSHLCGEEKVVWIDALKRLETIPCEETLDRLEISYNGLKNDQKEIFLDVACFMKGLQKEDAIRILESCGFHAIIGLRVLEQKSLVTISNQRLGMHDSIEELGRNIVRRLHPDEPNKHSRLWNPKEIEGLLFEDEGTEATTRIRLEQVELSPENIMKGLGKLQKLRVLLISDQRDDDFYRRDLKFDQAKQYFPNALQFLSWDGYHVSYLPQTFRGNNLVGLELPSSKITKLWETGDGKDLKKLRFLDLSYSKLRTLDLGITPKLERLNLRGCHDLTKLLGPDGCLKSLVYLNLIGCSKLNSFSFIKRLESLEIFSLSKLELIVESPEPQRYSGDNLPRLEFKCVYSEEVPSSSRDGLKSVSLNLKRSTKLESVSQSICGLQHLRHLTVDGCIQDLPNDLDRLAYLEKLNLVSARITCLPDSICTLKFLKSLKLKLCVHLKELPENLGRLEQLEKLSLLSAGIRGLPDSICILKHLKSLKLKSCSLLAGLPEGLGQLQCLEKLNFLSAPIKSLPDSICMLKRLKSLDLKKCRFLVKLPENLGRLERLEKLILTKCISLKDIPNSICKMKSLRHFCLLFCTRVEKLPEDLGNVECLEELNIKCTGICYLPHSISSRKDLRVVGSEALL